MTEENYNRMCLYPSKGKTFIAIFAILFMALIVYGFLAKHELLLSIIFTLLGLFICVSFLNYYVHPITFSKEGLTIPINIISRKIIAWNTIKDFTINRLGYGTSLVYLYFLDTKKTKIGCHFYQ